MRTTEFEDRIRNAEFVNDIPHFYTCAACDFKSHSRKAVIDHQLNECDYIGYLEFTSKGDKGGET